MKILTRYALKETVFPFFIALTLISFMLIMNKVLTLVDMVLRHGVGILVVFKLVAYILPSTFAVTIPMSLLVAAMIALGRLSSDMELVAIKAGGLSLSRIFVPLLSLGLVFSLGMLAFNEIALPRANQGYKTLFYDIVSQRSSVAIQENTYVSDFENLILHVRSKDPKSDRLEDLTVIKIGKNKEPLQWIQARSGRLVSDKENYRVYLQLNDGTVQFLGNDSMDNLTQLQFKASTVDLDMDGSLSHVNAATTDPKEMTIRESWDNLKRAAPGDLRRFHLAVEMHKKIAIPFACLSFMIIGFPLGILVRKGGRMLGFIYAIGLIFVYYIFLSVGQTYGDDGRLTPWFSMWLGNFALAAIGSALAYAALNEKQGWLPTLR